jgi:tyrosyl-tRNA synthetase
LNTSDADAEKYIKIFTFIPREDIEELIAEHAQAPHQRLLQKRLAEEITVMVHSKEEYENALRASNILFGQSTSKDLKGLNEKTFLEIFEGVPQAEVPRSALENGMDMIAALSAQTQFLGSNGEARRELKQNAISVNKEKVKEDHLITFEDLINDKFVLLQRGKKNYFVLVVGQ